jgi:hypothetical protein
MRAEAARIAGWLLYLEAMQAPDAVLQRGSFCDWRVLPGVGGVDHQRG